jgi:hypothetical protein
MHKSGSGGRAMKREDVENEPHRRRQVANVVRLDESIAGLGEELEALIPNPEDSVVRLRRPTVFALR